MKIWRISFRPFLAFGFLFCLTGCTATQTRKPVVDLPQYENAEQEKLFDTACAPLAQGEVQAYLQKLSQDNFQLAGAWERVRQAQAQAGQASAGLWPRVDLNLEASRSKAPFVLAGMGGGAQTGSTAAGGAYAGADTQAPAVIQNQFQAAATASYEVDVWNRLGSAADAAQFAVQAQDSNAQTLAVSLSAQLLESWYDLGFLHQQRDLLQRQLTTSEQLLKLAKLRFLNGQASALDALQQKQEVQRLQASLAQNAEQLAITANQLQVLLGESPLNTLNDLGPQLPDFRPMDSDISLSAGLLSVRPDLAGAWYQLRAADAQVASAVANRLPSVRLTASLFDQGRVVENVGDDIFWRVAAAITQPIFNAGALDAQVDAARAGADQALLTYRDTFLRALQDLANAWVGEAQAVERTRYLQAQQMLATDAFELVQTQYQRGAVDFLRVLNAFTSMVSVEQELLRARRSHLSYRVQFCTALGDGWLPEAAPPEPVLAEHVP